MRTLKCPHCFARLECPDEGGITLSCGLCSKNFNTPYPKAQLTSKKRYKSKKARITPETHDYLSVILTAIVIEFACLSVLLIDIFSIAQKIEENYDGEFSVFLAFQYLILPIIYFLPSIIAWYRKLPTVWSIFIANAVLAPLGVTHFICLIYSLKNNPN